MITVLTSNRNLSALCWSIAAVLLAFPLLTQAGVLACFAAGREVSPLLAPAALLLSLAAGDWLARREGMRGLQRIAPPAALAIFAASLCLSATFFDMSWDGLWYHQTAIYQMAHGWNPLADPMRSFVPSLQDYVRHYAKGPWYVSLAILKTTGHIEWAKLSTWMAWAAAFLAVTGAALEFGMRRRTAVLLATLVSLNPVVVCQLATYLVDGLLISYLACYVAAVAASFRRRSLLLQGVVFASTVLCINAKFSAIVYVSVFCAALGAYLLMRRRRLVLRFAAVQLATILLSIGVFGFNPYVTNAIHRGHPFYPWVGTAKYPSYAERGRDPNDMYETPHNMLGHNRFFRFAYAMFGRPGAQPFYPGKKAQLMRPFDVGWKDFQIFYFHDLRISGFGPLFSGAFLIAVALLGAALVRPGIPREIVLLLLGAVVVSLLTGLHMWWARYGPQLWWLPVIAVIGGLAVPGRRGVRWGARVLALLLLVNAALIAFVHFGWEIESTRTTYRQMAFLRPMGEIEVDLQYFLEPYGERLHAAGVAFHSTRTLHCLNPIELMSVPHGYPGVVRACAPQTAATIR